MSDKPRTIAECLEEMVKRVEGARYSVSEREDKAFPNLTSHFNAVGNAHLADLKLVVEMVRGLKAEICFGERCEKSHTGVMCEATHCSLAFDDDYLTALLTRPRARSSDGE